MPINKNFYSLKKLGFFCTLLISVIVGAQDYIVPNNGIVVADVSDKGVNRISIENDRISQIIGNEDEYILESDANLGQIFLTPSLKEASDINIRLVTEREKIIDAKLKVKKIEPQTINFKYEANATINTSVASSNDQNLTNGSFSVRSVDDITVEQQVIDNLKLVYNNKVPGTKVPALGCLKTNYFSKKLKLEDATLYALNDQIIIKAVIKSISPEKINLNESNFLGCLKVVKAVSIDNHHLNKGMNATVYMVGKDGK